MINQRAIKQKQVGKKSIQGWKLTLGGLTQHWMRDNALQSIVPKLRVLCSALCPSQACVGDSEPFQKPICHGFDQNFNEKEMKYNQWTQLGSIRGS